MAEVTQRRPPPAATGRLWCLGPPRTRFSLRVDLGAAAERAGARWPLATAPYQSTLRGEWAALWLGPDEQLLIGPESTPVEFINTVDTALREVPHSLVDVSHRQVALAIQGPQAVDLLNAGCPLDLDLTRFPVGACTRTVLAKSEIVLWRRANEEFHVEVWRSFVPYVSGFLAAVEKEYVDTLAR